MYSQKPLGLLRGFEWAHFPFLPAGGWHMHWLVVYFVLSILLGFALKSWFKVEI